MIVPRYTREIPHRMRLEAQRCNNCKAISLAPRLVCPECHETGFTTFALKPQGKVVTYTLIRVAAENFAQESPFAVGIIETSEGARLTAQIVDCDPAEISVGSEVLLMTRKIQTEGHAGILQYGYKAVLKR
jgi:uncharacterized OB-fold protein